MDHKIIPRQATLCEEYREAETDAASLRPISYFSPAGLTGGLERRVSAESLYTEAIGRGYGYPAAEPGFGGYPWLWWQMGLPHLLAKAYRRILAEKIQIYEGRRCPREATDLNGCSWPTRHLSPMESIDDRNRVSKSRQGEQHKLAKPSEYI